MQRIFHLKKDINANEDLNTNLAGIEKEKQSITKVFSANLARIRKEKGISQYKLAEQTGISRTMISYYESPGTIPPGDKLDILAKMLEVPVFKFFEQMNDMYSAADEINVAVEHIPEISIKNHNNMLNLCYIDKKQAPDLRSIRRFNDILSLKQEHRNTLYQMLDIMLENERLSGINSSSDVVDKNNENSNEYRMTKEQYERWIRARSLRNQNQTKTFKLTETKQSASGEDDGVFRIVKDEWYGSPCEIYCINQGNEKIQYFFKIYDPKEETYSDKLKLSLKLNDIIAEVLYLTLSERTDNYIEYVSDEIESLEHDTEILISELEENKNVKFEDFCSVQHRRKK